MKKSDENTWQIFTYNLPDINQLLHSSVLQHWILSTPHSFIQMIMDPSFKDTTLLETAQKLDNNKRCYSRYGNAKRRSKFSNRLSLQHNVESLRTNS